MRIRNEDQPVWTDEDMREMVVALIESKDSAGIKLLTSLKGWDRFADLNRKLLLAALDAKPLMGRPKSDFRQIEWDAFACQISATALNKKFSKRWLEVLPTIGRPAQPKAPIVFYQQLFLRRASDYAKYERNINWAMKKFAITDEDLHS